MVLIEKMSTRDRIIRASLELFTKKGYVATTTKEIAETASISEVTLFRHFKSKESIFRNMVDKYLPRLNQKLKEIHVPTEGKASEILSEVSNEMLKILQSESKLIRLTVQMPEIYPVKNDDLYEIGILVKERYKEILIEQYKNGKIIEKNWDIASRGLAAFLFGFFLMEAYYADLYQEKTVDMIRMNVTDHVKSWETE